MWGINFFFIPMFIQTVAAGFILANYCGYRYGLIFLIITMLFYLITQWGVKRYLVLQRKSFEASSLFSSFLINRLVNIESVFYYTNQGQEKKEASAYLKEIEEAETKAKSSMESLRIFQSICVGSGLMIVTILSAIAVFTHAGNMGEFVMINSYILQFTAPLSSLGLVLSDIYRGFTCVEGLFNSINEKKQPPDSELKISFRDIEKIELVDVSYKYPNSSSPIIENLSLSIKAAEKIGFFGDSGSGKTTIIKLLLKRINSTNGKILINDIPIGNFNTQELHQKITVVPQRVELFKGTLFYNLGFGNNQISEDEINDSLSITYLSYLINRLPKGLHSEIGEFGQMLSGGERQRIAIAMALLRKPQFLILDEALSFVDKKTANKILASLKKIPWLKGFILVSHDLSLFNSLDKIFFFNNGALQVVNDYEKFLKVESA
jgi:ATP-binding cassette subfamily B protein